MISTEYAAGFFDGEGTVAIVKRKYGYAVQVSVYQSTLPVLELFRERWSGSISTNNRGQHTWSAWSRDAEAFLREVLPHLLTKGHKATCALELLDTIPPKGVYHRGNPIPLKVLRQREDIIRRFHD